jgi:hypothetical protein
VRNFIVKAAEKSGPLNILLIYPWIIASKYLGVS